VCDQIDGCRGACGMGVGGSSPYQCHQLAVSVSTMRLLTQWDMAQHARKGLLGGAEDITAIVQLPVLGSINHYAVS
jgi:hypothetical protein